MSKKMSYAEFIKKNGYSKEKEPESSGVIEKLNEKAKSDRNIKATIEPPVYDTKSINSIENRAGIISESNIPNSSSASKPTSQKRVVNMKEDEANATFLAKTEGMTDEERKRFLVEEARKRSKSTSNADIVMKQLKRQDAGAWKQEKAEYNYRKENGLLEKNDAKTQHYIDRFYSMSEDERQLVANIYADIEVNHGHKDLQAKNKYTSAVNKLKFEYGYTDEDIEAMRYFYGRYINKKNAKTDDINARLAMDKHPVLESLASIPTGLAGGVMAAGGILDSYIDNKAVEKIGIQDQGIDYNHEFSKMQRQAQSGRDQFTKTHDFMIGGYDVGDLLYNTALSGAESATAAMIPGGAALLAVNAGTAKVNELSQRGLSSKKAIAGGLAAAATEMIFESVSIGNFKKMQEVEPNTIMDVVANIAKSMGVNASEEALTEAANIVYDTVMHGDKSDYQMQVEYLVNEKGMTREAAEKKARTGLLGQVGEAALSGAIMGVGFGGVASVPNYIGRSAAIEAMGIQAKKSGMKDEIIAEAKAAPKNSKANKTVNREIKKSEKSGEAISDYKLGLMAVQSNDVALKDTGRFSNVKTEAELEERYQSAMQMSKKAKATADSIEVKSDKQIQKEYEQAKARIRMQAAAKAEADKFEGAQKTERKANKLTRIEITNPTIEVEGKRYSIEGKNFDSKTEEIGDAQTVFKDADGDNAVRFGDGQTMKVSEAVEKMTDETAKEVYKATEGMSPEAANLFISNYDGDTVPEYKDAFKYYFNMGRAGLTAEDIRKDNELYGTYFTAEAQRQIATAGLKSREFKAGVTELTFSRSTKPYKQTVQLIDQWAKESGLEVIILKNSDKVNGYHLQGTNRIVLYTEVDGKENILTRTFGHETFHFISENSSAEAEKLCSYVIEALEKNGVDIEKALQKYADITDGEGNNVYSTRESQIDELVADSMFDVFTNKAAIERLAKNDRTLAQKIYDKFKDILNIIKSKLKLFDTMNNNPEIRALMNDADSLEQIVNKFHDALDVAKNNFNVHDSGKDAGKNFSFAAAARTRPDVITEAEKMEKDGATKKQIWEKLGLIRDASGIWVYEIDDSVMKIFPNGDALIKKEKGYQRMMEIFNKAFVNGEQLTEAEQKEYSELDKKYKLEKKTSWKLEDFVEHDELFHNYPQLRKAGFEFADLGSGKAGTYDPKTNTIYISESRKKSLHSLPGTAIHEIQHAIQHIDNRANGTSPEYWKKKIADKSRDMAEKINERKIESIEYLNSLDNELRSRIREINRADTSSAVGEKSEHEVLKEQLLKDDKTGAYKKYLEMSADIDRMTTEWKNYLDSADSMRMYRDTAGEIEAREAASRLKMPAEERTEKMPDLGQERAVFAERERKNESIEQTTDNRMVVVVKDDIVKNSTNNSDLIKKVKQALGRFPKIPIHNQEIIIGRKAKKETVYSKYTQNIRKNDVQKYNDKMNLLNHPYELIYATTDYINEPLNHPRKDNIIDFARGTVLMSIGGRNYLAKVIVGYTSSGVCELYDVIDFDDSVTFQIRKTDNSQAVHPQEMEFDRYELSDDNMISQNDTSVNDNFMQSSSDDVPKKITSMNSSEKSLDEMKADRSTLQDEYRELKGQIDNLKASEEYFAFEYEIRKVRKNGSLFGGFETVKEIRRQRDEWADEAGLTELQKRYHDISEQIHDYDLAIYKIEKEQKIKATEETAKKVKAFTHDVVMKYATDAAKKFGITKKFENAGYMLPDGKLLDFSDGQGYRVLDHREIKNVLDFLPDGQNYSDGLIQFMNMGNIRMQIGGIDISRMPSNEQIPVLRKFFKENNGEITVDFSKENGDNAGSVEYPAGTSSDRILNDIKSYFTTGNVPKLTGAAAFHAMFSVKNNDPVTSFNIRTAKENKVFREIFTLLDEMAYSGIKVKKILSNKSIGIQAEKIIKKTGSTYSKKRLIDELSVIYDYMSQNIEKGLYKTEDFYNNVLSLSNRIIDKCSVKNTDLYDKYAEPRNFLYNVEIYIPDNVKKEIISRFGDYKSFRNLLMGKVMHISTTNTEARSLDEVWQELSEMAPEYFPKETNELDMPMRLVEFYDAIAPTLENPHISIEKEASILAGNIIEGYFKVEKLTSDDDIYKEYMKEHLSKIRDEEKKLRKTLEEESKTELKTRIDEYKRRNEYNERARIYRNSIDRQLNYLNNRYEKRADNYNIPAKFEGIVKALVDFMPSKENSGDIEKIDTLINEVRRYGAEVKKENDDSNTNTFDEIVSKLEYFKYTVKNTDTMSAIDNKGEISDKRKGISLVSLTNEELGILDDAITMIKHAIQTDHKLLVDKKTRTIEAAANEIEKETSGKILPRIKELHSKLIIPEYLFERLGPTAKRLYDNVRKGENIVGRILNKSKELWTDVKKLNSYDKRWKYSSQEIELRSGKYNINTMDLMSIYAVSKQEEGLEHLLNGGMEIVQAKHSRKHMSEDERKVKLEKEEKTHVFLTKEDIQKLSDSLNEKQKNYVDDVVIKILTKYLGGERNNVSMVLFGIEKYRSKYYFPLSVDKNYIDTNMGRQQTTSSIKNQSSSKPRVPNAHQPIVITGFDDVVAKHMHDSAMYCGYVLPLEDLKKVIGYSTTKRIPTDGAEFLRSNQFSVRDNIIKLVGNEYFKRIETFIKDADSGMMKTEEPGKIVKGLTNAKKAAVSFNPSVVIQQPFAFIRGLQGISPKSIVLHTNKADIEEMKRLNGCAVIKEIGYFDAGSGRTDMQWLSEYKTEKFIKNNWKVKDIAKIIWDEKGEMTDKIGGFFASKADEQTWGCLWNTIKKEAKRLYPELQGDDLLEKASEMFQDMIAKTQVYDSVFAKCEAMRQNTIGWKTLTAFKGEPILSRNVIENAFFELRNAPKSQKKEAAHAFAVSISLYVTSTVFTNAAKSIIQSIRDDDEDKSFWEKYFSNLLEGTVMDPFGMTVIFSQILNIVKGYELSNLDANWIENFSETIQKTIKLGEVYSNENSTEKEKEKAIRNFVYSVLDSLGSMTGIPAARTVKNTKTIVSLISDRIKNGKEPTTAKGIEYAIQSAFDIGWISADDTPNNYEQLYIAMVEGDKKHYDKIYSNLVNSGQKIGKNEDEIKNTIDSNFATILAEKDSRVAQAYLAHENRNLTEAAQYVNELKQSGFSDAAINKAIAKYQDELIKKLENDERITMAAQARYNMDFEKYEQIIDELVADGYNEIIVKETVDKNKIALEKYPEEYSLNEKEKYSGEYDMKNALINGDSDDIEKLYGNMVEELGESEAKEQTKSAIKAAYKNDYLSEEKAGELLKEYVDSDYSDTDVWKELYKTKASRDSIYDKVYDAIDYGGGFSVDYLLEQGIERDDIADAVSKKYKSKLLDLEKGTKEYNELYENLIDAYVTIGKSEGYAIAKIRNWHSDAAKAERKKNMRK